MGWTLLIWLLSAALLVALMTQRHWDQHLPQGLVRLRALVRGLPLPWLLLGYPLTVLRMVATWRRLATTAGLAVVRRPRYAVIGDQAVRGMSLRPIPARLGLPLPTSTGLRVRISLHPGQTPGEFIGAADAFAHAWHVYAVRVTSPNRGTVLVTVTAKDPLAHSAVDAWPPKPARLLAADVGRCDEGGPWEIDFRAVPHWLVTGATQSGKSTLMAALVCQLAPQPVALVGIDCKGGLELSLFEPRLTALADSRTAAVGLLDGLVSETESRMAACRRAGVRSIWELGEDRRPVPIVVLVDELAELYLHDGSRAGKQESEACSASLLRIAQLGAALGVHLVVSGQRVGSELGRLVTALRAQLGGRICHRVTDNASAEMTLGDLAPDAVTVARSIKEDEQGVAVTTNGAGWMRARSLYTTTEQARDIATLYTALTPALPGLGSPTLTKGGDDW
jgi:S-DNA-T family DNA segregation ATPase FtsK/SpoIIIE